jgi:dipeptide/tripeptide permease
MNILYKTIYSLVLLIGVGCFGIGVSSVCGYLAGRHYLTRWIGEVPMAFSTSVVIMFIGLALFLIGQNHLADDKPIRQI